jgi:GntR family carbon starvation induced transcriptional regulator
MDKFPARPSTDRSDAETSATQKTYFFEIRRMILEGDLRPGQKLKINALKLIIGSGASSIREALSLLTSDQLVERIVQRGFRAAPTSQANFDEILRLRCALEDMALRDSIAAATPEWEDRVVLAHHQMVKAKREGAAETDNLHKAFQMVIIEMCGSPILLKFCNQLYDLNVWYRNLAGQARSYRNRDIDKEHADIFHAIVQRDAEAATAHLLNHYRQTGAFDRAVKAA